MRFAKSISVFCTGLLAAATVQALTISDVDVNGQDGDPHWVYMKKSKNSASVWSDTFNILEKGFDPVLMEIIGATVKFAFADDGRDGAENAKIVVGGETLWSNQEVDGSHYNSPYSYDWYQATLGTSLLADLQDGILNYSVSALKGDFYLKEAAVYVEYSPIDVPDNGNLKVPDTGATLGMLGLGIATMFILRRQMLKGKDA